MKRLILLIAALTAVLSAFAQDYNYVEATDLTIVGKVFPDTPDPYKRMDFGLIDPHYDGIREDMLKALRVR